MRLRQELEDEKSRELIDVKSKELASYSLQMIDKDKALNELLQTIKVVSPEKYGSLKHKYGKQANKLWEEFNLRFLEINSDFYTRLSGKHPNLTTTEQKHCALIKLSFDSNEMAQILNISLQSVHTSRYRIRKKNRISPRRKSWELYFKSIKSNVLLTFGRILPSTLFPRSWV